MRPNRLTPLFAGARTLQGIGPRIEKLLQRLFQRGGEDAGARVLDLLLHLPVNVIDRRARPKISEAVPRSYATLSVTVAEHTPSRGPGRPYRIWCEDETGGMELVFFNPDRRYLERRFPPGETRIVSGRIDNYGGRPQMVHPDHVVSEAEFASLPLVEPVYPLTGGLSGKILQRAIRQALERLPDLPDWQDADWLAARQWPGFGDALRALHRPQSPADLSPDAPSRQRIAYDELLANQLALALMRARLRKAPGRPLAGTGTLRKAIIAALPFALTGAQRQALNEIDADLAAPHRMLRLLRGDVGSGKTVVALLAMASAVEAGRQAALMAPTDVLARQHAQTVAPLADKAGFRMALLTGREKGRERARTLARLQDGDIDIVVGTHALFQESVTFRDLALAAIDEQHRYGVHQRLALQTKGDGVDVLVMTATPIPRTLLLTHYGDMEASQLTEKPAGRRPVATRAVPLERIAEVVDRLEAAVRDGAQAYWVCPLVEESEGLDVAAAQARFDALKLRFGEKVGLVHGRMKGRDKDRAMAGFASGEIAVLVATTVVEVGVDVPNAAIMTIEHAERFGLAQLHQLRGRVGRGDRPSSCILLYRPPLGETAKARLNVLRETDDGFRIAEEDLRLRGGGEVLGARQSGMPHFRVARLPDDAALLAAARDDAKLILARDPELASQRGEALRTLLYLFERDEAVRLLRAG